MQARLGRKASSTAPQAAAQLAHRGSTLLPLVCCAVLQRCLPGVSAAPDPPAACAVHGCMPVLSTPMHAVKTV